MASPEVLTPSGARVLPRAEHVFSSSRFGVGIASSVSLYGVFEICRLRGVLMGVSLRVSRGVTKVLTLSIRRGPAVDQSSILLNVLFILYYRNIVFNFRG